MDKIFKKIDPSAIKESAFKLIGSDWMLITAGNIGKFNMMTASWGGLGVIWERNVCYCVIRPGRHTYGFMEKAQYYTICFFDEKYRDALNYCGTKSGKEEDKAAGSGLTPVKSDLDSVYFDEASIVMECRKIYYQDLDPKNFLDKVIEKNYPLKDYHRMYIGEIVNCFKR
jgi:flavin reductase (DIM6/NTAB) family NADH-FMN oxidoreductase RutF